MTSFSASMAAYEDGLRKIFKSAFREDDLEAKHKLMQAQPFVFLRGTCWRWAEAAPDLCPGLMSAPRAGSVGDAHAGNFGLWADAEGRLVWGANDFDEAAMLPYALDLVRLCASFMVPNERLTAGEVADPLLAGYGVGLERPHAFVLEREHLWLRDAFASKDESREGFWDKLDQAAPATPPKAYAEALETALDPVEGLRFAPRRAGVGSLGRPRFVAWGVMRGGPAAREAKGRAPSCWNPAEDLGLSGKLAGGAWRSPDPHLDYRPAMVLRRLAPNSRKIGFDDLKAHDAVHLIHAMAADLAAIHLSAGDGAAIAADLRQRPGDWLKAAARTVADWTLKEFHAYRD